MLHPGVLWGCLTQGTLIVFIVAVSAVIGLIFGGPPNFFTVQKVGYFYVGPFVGGMLGFLSGIFSSSRSANRKLVYYPIGYVKA